MNRTRKRAVVLVALAVIAAGCSEDGSTTKAGGDSAPVTLRLGTEGVQGRPEGNQMEEFARQVQQLSGGDVTIELVWEAGRLPDERGRQRAWTKLWPPWCRTASLTWA